MCLAQTSRLGKKTVMKLFRTLLALVLAVGATGCALQRFSGGPYTSPDGVFTCQVPSSNLGWKSERGAGQGSSGASWCDDFDGALYKVELIDSQMLPPAFQKLSAKEQTMQSLDSVILSNIRSVCPSARMVSKRYLPGECSGGALGVFDVPGGSPTVVSHGLGSANMRSFRPDVTRNVFVFRSGHWLVIVTHIGERLGSIINHGNRASSETQAAKDLPSLLALARSIRVMKS